MADLIPLLYSFVRMVGDYIVYHSEGNSFIIILSLIGLVTLFNMVLRACSTTVYIFAYIYGFLIWVYDLLIKGKTHEKNFKYD